MRLATFDLKNWIFVGLWLLQHRNRMICLWRNTSFTRRFSAPDYRMYYDSPPNCYTFYSSPRTGNLLRLLFLQCYTCNYHSTCSPASHRSDRIFLFRSSCNYSSALPVANSFGIIGMTTSDEPPSERTLGNWPFHFSMYRC